MPSRGLLAALQAPSATAGNGRPAGWLGSRLGGWLARLEPPGGLGFVLVIVPLSRYVRFKALKENPDLRECPRCGRFQVGDPLHPQIHCEACGLAYCFAHGSAHPPSESCADYEQRSTPAATRDLLRRTSKPCPKCKAPTFRATGCNHMKCTQCKADWCWLCGESITVRGTGVFPSHYDWRSLDSPCAGMQYTDDENARGGQSPYRKACRILLFYSPLAIPFYLQAMLVYLLITVFTAPCLAASASYRAYWFRMSIIHSVVTIGYATIGSAVAFLCLGLVAVVAWVLLLIGGVLGLPFLPCFVSSRAGCARYLRFLCCWPFDFLPSGASDTQ